MNQGRNDPCLCGSGKKYKKCCSNKPAAGLAFQASRPPARTTTQRTHSHHAPSQQEVGALMALFNSQRYMDAKLHAQSMTEKFPRYGFGWKALGAVFKQMGQSANALMPMQKAATLLPNDAEVHYNLGFAFQEIGRLSEAEASYRRTLQINPDFVEAYNNLGGIFQSFGQFDAAATSYRRALQIKPDYAEAHYNLGNTLYELGCLDKVEACYCKALQIKPNFTDAINKLALLFNAQGKSAKALGAIKQSLQFKVTEETKNTFTACLKHLRCTQDDSEIRRALICALTEPWGRPSELARISADFIKLNPDIGGCVARADDAWPQQLTARELFGTSGLAALASDALLIALLKVTPICDMKMERFFTMARHALLESFMDAPVDDVGHAMRFYSALASQCFINEYVFSYTDDEIGKAIGLRDSLVAALEADNRIPDLWPVAVAAYFPLCSLPLADRLLERPWPEEVAAVLRQQISEPIEEQHLRATIPQLTNIEDEVSLLVQNQYEENPYPRWVKMQHAVKSMSITEYLYGKFPQAFFKRHIMSGSINVLIAGCGTGQHSIGTAQQIQGAQVLAIDLSMSSLGYAKRKTQELGMTSVEYAQADLLKIGSLGHSFDVIESVGVLHHLADPWAGWQVLLSLLRPGGFMRLGFYSATARRNVVRIRDFIAKHGYGSTAEDIRQRRQDLVELNKSEDFGNTLASLDFFSISTCRDLLFHTNEHRLTLTGIDAFLQKNKLAFVGFEVDTNVLHAYKLRFPDDRAATNLGYWEIFENENPDTFFGMYQFWIQQV